MWRLVGIAAACLTMLGFVPQIVKVMRSKSVKDVSLITLIQFSAGVALWTVYGVYLRDSIIILANSITLATLIILLILYLKYRRSE